MRRRVTYTIPEGVDLENCSFYYTTFPGRMKPESVKAFVANQEKLKLSQWKKTVAQRVDATHMEVMYEFTLDGRGDFMILTVVHDNSKYMRGKEYAATLLAYVRQDLPKKKKEKKAEKKFTPKLKKIPGKVFAPGDAIPLALAFTVPKGQDFDSVSFCEVSTLVGGYVRDFQQITVGEARSRSERSLIIDSRFTPQTKDTSFSVRVVFLDADKNAFGQVEQSVDLAEKQISIVSVKDVSRVRNTLSFDVTFKEEVPGDDVACFVSLFVGEDKILSASSLRAGSNLILGKTKFGSRDVIWHVVLDYPLGLPESLPFTLQNHSNASFAGGAKASFVVEVPKRRWLPVTVQFYSQDYGDVPFRIGKPSVYPLMFHVDDKERRIKFIQLRDSGLGERKKVLGSDDFKDLTRSALSVVQKDDGTFDVFYNYARVPTKEVLSFDLLLVAYGHDNKELAQGVLSIVHEGVTPEDEVNEPETFVLEVSGPQNISLRDSVVLSVVAVPLGVQEIIWWMYEKGHETVNVGNGVRLEFTVPLSGESPVRELTFVAQGLDASGHDIALSEGYPVTLLGADFGRHALDYLDGATVALGNLREILAPHLRRILPSKGKAALGVPGERYELVSPLTSDEMHRANGLFDSFEHLERSLVQLMSDWLGDQKDKPMEAPVPRDQYPLTWRDKEERRFFPGHLFSFARLERDLQPFSGDLRDFFANTDHYGAALQSLFLYLGGPGFVGLLERRRQFILWYMDPGHYPLPDAEPGNQGAGWSSTDYDAVEDAGEGIHFEVQNEWDDVGSEEESYVFEDVGDADASVNDLGPDDVDEEDDGVEFNPGRFD